MLDGKENFIRDITSPEDISKERREEIIGNLAQEIVERNLVAPAIMFLETMKPLSFIGSQLMVMANPFVQVIFNSKLYWEITVLLEDRENVDYLIQEIERRS
jgi:hypothetical protein